MASLPELEDALKNADAAGATADARMLADEIVRLRSARPAADSAAVMERMPVVKDRYSQRYNPNQSTTGYVGNELGKAMMGLASIPNVVMEQEARNPLPGPMSALARLGAAAREKMGVPSIERISRILGIDPGIKPPGPGTEFLTGAGVDVAQNMLFPGGTIAQKVAGGVGSYLGRRIGEGSAGGELAGSMLGGVAAPAMLATRWDALRSVKNAIGGSPQEAMSRLQQNPEVMGRLRRDVLNELAESLRADPDTYAAKFAAASDLESSIPGLKLNLGQRFMAPSVLQKQRSLEASSPTEMNAAQARRTSNESVLRGALGESPGARSSAESAIEDMTRTAAGRSRDLSAEIARVSDEANAIAGKVSAQADLPALGQRALDIRASELGKARMKANELMDLASTAAKTEQAQFDASGIIAKVEGVLKEPIWDDANVTSIFGKVRGLSGSADAGFDWNPITGGTPKAPATSSIGFEDVREMRQAVNADIAAALRSNSPNARAQLRNLSTLKSDIDAMINASPYEQTKKAYGDFIQFYKSEFSPRFLRGANLLADKTTSLGESRLPPERVFSTYFKPNGATEMSRYLKLYGENTEAMSAMRDAITDRYTKEVMSGGSIKPSAHARFMERYKTPLETLNRSGFGFAKELDDTASAYSAVQDRLASLKDAAERADKDSVRAMISDQFGAKTPEQVFGDALADPRRMNALLGRMTSQQAKGALEFINDDLARQFSSGGTVSADAIDAFLSDRMRVMSYRNAVAKTYSIADADAQIKTLRDIAEAARRLDSTPIPSSAAVPGRPSLFKDEMQKATGISIAVAGNMLRAVVAGRVSPEWAALALGSQAGATIMQNMKNEIYKEILRDPQSARMLLQMMRAPKESAGTLAAVGRFLSKAPKVAGYFVGLNKYPEFAKYAASNFARSQAEPQEKEWMQ